MQNQIIKKIGCRNPKHQVFPHQILEFWQFEFFFFQNLEVSLYIVKGTHLKLNWCKIIYVVETTRKMQIVKGNELVLWQNDAK